MAKGPHSTHDAKIKIDAYLDTHVLKYDATKKPLPRTAENFSFVRYPDKMTHGLVAAYIIKTSGHYCVGNAVKERLRIMFPGKKLLLQQPNRKKKVKPVVNKKQFVMPGASAPPTTPNPEIMITGADILHGMGQEWDDATIKRVGSLFFGGIDEHLLKIEHCIVALPPVLQAHNDELHDITKDIQEIKAGLAALVNTLTATAPQS